MMDATVLQLLDLRCLQCREMLLAALIDYKTMGPLLNGSPTLLQDEQTGMDTLCVCTPEGKGGQEPAD